MELKACNTGNRDQGSDPNVENAPTGIPMRDEMNADDHSEELGPPAYEAFSKDRHIQDYEYIVSPMSDDGRLNINLEGVYGSFLEKVPLLPATPQNEEKEKEHEDEYTPQILEPFRTFTAGKLSLMNIVIHAIGAYDDVRPLVSLGRTLRLTHGHRVRVATHPIFQQLVERNSLEFFSVGVEPSQLIDYTRPSSLSVFPKLDGELFQAMQACWWSCLSSSEDGSAFVASAIIANPQSFAHIHCAEKLGIPLHIVSTVPWTPTRRFPHPLANMNTEPARRKAGNFVSYHLVEKWLWGGIGDAINRLRTKTLGLDSINQLYAIGLLNRLRINITYCWSQALLPKPRNWDSDQFISGFFEDPLALPNDYIPTMALFDFLAAGQPPVYFCFDSVKVEQNSGFTQLLLDTVQHAGIRAIISKGRSNLGDELHTTPDNVFFIDGDRASSDWIIKNASGVVHPGSSEINSLTLSHGKPGIVVPFVGDQFFWADAVYNRGAGPRPIPHKELSAEALAITISEALEPILTDIASDVGRLIQAENGLEAAARRFLAQIDGYQMSCSVLQDRPAAWQVKGRDMRLSTFAAAVLIKQNVLKVKDMQVFRPIEYETSSGPTDPITGVLSATMRTVGEVLMGVASGPIEAYRQIKRADSHHSSPSPMSESSSSVVARPVILQDNESIRADSNRHIRSISSSKAKDPLKPVEEVAAASAKGLVRIVGAGLKSPVTVTHGLTRGFHNLPSLYGDTTVRKQDEVTGVKSGVTAAAKGLGYGVVDGVTGFFTQPVEGARKGGARGFVKGFGKGLGGIIFKPAAGACGVAGHTFMGIYKELHGVGEGNDAVVKLTIAARLAQGDQEWNQASAAEKQNVLDWWQTTLQD